MSPQHSGNSTSPFWFVFELWSDLVCAGNGNCFSLVLFLCSSYFISPFEIYWADLPDTRPSRLLRLEPLACGTRLRVCALISLS